GGNPLALLELPHALSERQRTGEEQLGEPIAVTDAVQAAFASQIESLSQDARNVLVVAAAEPSGELRLIGLACREIGLQLAELERAEARSLVSLREGSVTFRHPLVRAAAYHAASPAGRRAAHRALAGVVECGDDRRAWHLAAA